MSVTRGNFVIFICSVCKWKITTNEPVNMTSNVLTQLLNQAIWHTIRFAFALANGIFWKLIKWNSWFDIKHLTSICANGKFLIRILLKNIYLMHKNKIRVNQFRHKSFCLNFIIGFLFISLFVPRSYQFVLAWGSRLRGTIRHVL